MRKLFNSAKAVIVTKFLKKGISDQCGGVAPSIVALLVHAPEKTYVIVLESGQVVTVACTEMAEPLANGSHSAQNDDDVLHARAESAKTAANQDFKGVKQMQTLLKRLSSRLQSGVILQPPIKGNSQIFASS